MIPSDTFQTKSSQIYTTIKQDITTGAYRPGTHLVRRDLVKRFGVSLSIVNEALGRLGSDGLVETKEMYGTRVIALNPAMLRELARGGVPVLFDAEHAAAHNKVMVIDGKKVVTGSYNFTQSAESRNAENLLVIDDDKMAKAYLDNWTQHRDGARVFAAK